jgi:hypothetical protein
MKKAIISLLVILALGAVAVVTCPDKQAHKDAIMSVVNERINDELKPAEGGDDGLSVFFGSIGSGVAGFFLDSRLTVKNHFVYSTGAIKDLEGNDQTVSVGVFGHVFTFKKEDLDKVVHDME